MRVFIAQFLIIFTILSMCFKLGNCFPTFVRLSQSILPVSVSSISHMQIGGHIIGDKIRRGSTKRL